MNKLVLASVCTVLLLGGVSLAGQNRERGNDGWCPMSDSEDMPMRGHGRMMRGGGMGCCGMGMMSDDADDMPMHGRGRMMRGGGMGCGMGMMNDSSEDMPMRGRGRMMHGGGMGMRGFGRLDLSDEQIEKMQAVRTENRDAMESAMARVRETRDAMRELEFDDVATDEAIRNAASDFAKARADLDILRNGIQRKMREVLTEEQKKELEQMNQDRQSRRDERRENRGEGRRNRSGQQAAHAPEVK